MLGGIVELIDELSLLLGDEYELEGLGLLPPIGDEEDDELVSGRAVELSDELSLLLGEEGKLDG